MHSRQITGKRGEQRVVEYLKQQGYTIVATNVSWHQHGEIDIIATKNEYIACIEVKTRYNKAVPFTQLVPRSKQKKIMLVARWFVQKYKKSDKVVRFDVAFVDMTQQPPSIDYLKNAFWG